MTSRTHRTKIVATIGPASSSPEVLTEMVQAGMTVARLNFSHGTYEDHAQTIQHLRAISTQLKTPITLLQDLQGPKIRVGQLPTGACELMPGERINLVPLTDASPTQADHIAIDYPYLAEEAIPGMQILLDDGLLELQVKAVSGSTVECQVIEGGRLKSRKGVNLPNLNLRLPSLTEKDKQDLTFGIAQGVDWVSLSFVRQAADIEALKMLLAEQGAADMPVIAKIEKPQAIDNLEEILDVSDGVMVARGDLGVEMSPERVPLLQKRIIRACNLRSLPVITATQMLESMITNPRPTRAEASDVANAIMDGTDAVMLSGEAAVGQYPVKSVQMLAKIAADVEPDIQYALNPPLTADNTNVLAEALNTIDKVTDLAWIVTFTSSGYTAMIAAGERPRAPVIALTPSLAVYHRLNLVWGVIPLFIQDQQVNSFESLVDLAQTTLLEQDFVDTGDYVLIMGGIPPHRSRGTNFIKLHHIEAVAE